MDCSCGIDVDPDSEPEFYYSSVRVARKFHKCDECKEEIEPGDTYEHVSGTWENEWLVNKTCSDCISARDVFFNSGWYMGAVWDMIFEFIDESYGDVSSDCIKGLTPKARDKVCDYIESYFKDQDEEE